MQALSDTEGHLGAPTVVAIEMGYGHLRPARSLANALGVGVFHADRAPLADEQEQKGWQTLRRVYETTSRISGTSRVAQAALDGLTSIPSLYPLRDLSARTPGVHLLEYAARRGLGSTMVSYLQERNSPLLTTFYSPAVFADYHGYDRIYCVVTDSDVNRVWAPFQPRTSKVHYFAPSGRVVRRLRAYGVPQDHIELTGFPLPHELLGGPDLPVLKNNLRRRIARLDSKGVFRRQFHEELQAAFGGVIEDGQPPHLAFAVGGSGAQAEMPDEFLPSLKPMLDAGQLRLTLVAGARHEVKEQFEQQLIRHGIRASADSPVHVLYEDDVDRYFARFDELLADVDILWTKPSEMTFYGGLGIALLLAPPVGRHEYYNRRWARENVAGVKQRDTEHAGEWLREWLSDGTLAMSAWAGYKRLPSLGLYRIVERLTSEGFPEHEHAAG